MPLTKTADTNET